MQVELALFPLLHINLDEFSEQKRTEVDRTNLVPGEVERNLAEDEPSGHRIP